MAEVGAWEIPLDGGKPLRMDADRDFLEKHLEDWIGLDPSLLGPDIRWLSRQLVLPDLSRLDLLGLTKDGTWVIAELKAGSVDAGTVRQAFHYFIEIAMMDNAELIQRVRAHPIRDEHGVVIVDPSVETDLALIGEDPHEQKRDYMLLAAGVGTGESAEAAAAVLAAHNFDVPVRVVTFQLLKSGSETRILVREVDEDEDRAPASDEGWTLDALLELAQRHGVRDEFEEIRTGLLDRGYKSLQKKYGLNFNPGAKRQAFWVSPRDQAIHVGYLDWNLEALFNLDQSWAEEHLGENWVDLPAEQARDRVLGWADAIAFAAASLSGATEGSAPP